MTNLVIVESPAKATTIKGYLGSSYQVIASKGHVRDLPKSTLGIDVDNNFSAHYINIRGKGDLIKELKKEAKKADRIFLATDPDREGEAISWHLAIALGIPVEKAKRITFNEITKTAVKEAIKKPREIDMDLVNAQQARRILDRLVGYKLSPFLWKTVKSGLSAGRVQSVATRIIVERENEIRAFVPKEYWTVDALLETAKGKALTVRYHGDAGSKDKKELNCAADAETVRTAVEGKNFTVADVKKGTRAKHPAPPFITSTLQQEAFRKLNFQSQRTMRVAQELYEGINVGSDGVHGLITYMRTDSLRVSTEAQTAAKEYISAKYGEKYVPESYRVYKSKANSQDAHEAIRPSSLKLEPQKVKKYLSNDQYKVYKLIWDRFIASQMQDAELDTVSAELEAGGCGFKASGYTVRFNGFMAVYEESTDEADEEKNEKLPPLEKGDVLKNMGVNCDQHFTEPPARYTEASLTKFLEEKGIGRPSTYTPIITIIISRGYVSRDGKSLVPTPLGEVITDIMVKNFPDVVDYKFTASMEDSLDSIENGEADLEGTLEQFYGSFKRELEAAEATVSKENIVVPVEETDIICDKCGSTMILKNGRFGKFAACPNYPECKNTKPLVKKEVALPVQDESTEGMKCEKCGADMVLRNGRYGAFYACSKYPECKFTKQKGKGLGVNCPDCGSEIVTKYGKNRTVFYSCSKYPECSFSSWDMPTAEKCPQCGGMLYRKKGKSNIICCKKEGCGYKAESAVETNEEN